MKIWQVHKENHGLVLWHWIDLSDLEQTSSECVLFLGIICWYVYGICCFISRVLYGAMYACWYLNNVNLFRSLSVHQWCWFLFFLFFAWICSKWCIVNAYSYQMWTMIDDWIQRARHSIHLTFDVRSAEYPEETNDWVWWTLIYWLMKIQNSLISRM